MLLAAFALRVAGFVTQPHVIFLDETFQYFEQAHRLVYGSGLLPWEFHDGIRSWLLPGALAGLMRLAGWVSDSPLAYLDLARGLAALLSLSVVWVGFRLGERGFGLWGAMLTGLFCALWFDPVWFAPAVMTEVLAVHVWLVGYWLAERGGRRRLVLSGACHGLAVCLRYQYVPALLAAALWQNRRDPRRWGWLVAGGLPVVLAAAGLLDWLTLGAPFQSMWLNFQLNAMRGVAGAIGSDPPLLYVAYLSTALWPAWLLLPLLLVGVIRAPALGLAALVTVVLHSLAAHKEPRFIYLAIAVAPILIGLGAAHLLQFTVRPRLIWPATAGVLAGGAALSAWASFAGPLAPRWQFERATVQAFLAAHDQPGLCGLGVRELPVFETGGYSYLHRDVPLYLETFEPVLHIPPSPVPLPLAMIFRGAPLRQFSGSAFPENIRYFNGLIASADNGLAGYAPVACASDMLRGGRPMLCLFRRPGGCDPP